MSKTSPLRWTYLQKGRTDTRRLTDPILQAHVKYNRFQWTSNLNAQAFSEFPLRAEHGGIPRSFRVDLDIRPLPHPANRNTNICARFRLHFLPRVSASLLFLFHLTRVSLDKSTGVFPRTMKRALNLLPIPKKKRRQRKGMTAELGLECRRGRTLSRGRTAKEKKKRGGTVGKETGEKGTWKSTGETEMQFKVGPGWGGQGEDTSISARTRNAAAGNLDLKFRLHLSGRPGNQERAPPNEVLGIHNLIIETQFRAGEEHLYCHQQ